MAELRISPDLTLPQEAVTQTFAILAKRGVGKTYTASVLTEELLKAKLPVAVVDPVGVWWGLRSSADGKKPGLPITVLGGDHGDVPLEPSGGELVADLVVDERLPVVLDLSLFRKGQQVQFMTAFAERLYHRNREALHLVLDEADAFAPQKPQKGQERMLGAVEDLVRRGRARGLGITLVTQRSAVLNKDVLTQTEVLVAMRTTSPQDRNAIKAWIEFHGEGDEQREVLASLPSLPIGTAWIWSPGWLGILERVRIRERETYDSSATPKAGQRQAAPKTFADVDLDELRERMAATIERAKAEDPKELRRRIATLERELAKNPTQVEEVVKEVEVPVLQDEQLDQLDEAIDAIGRAAGKIVAATNEVAAALGKARRLPAPAVAAPARPARTAPPPRRAAAVDPADVDAQPSSSQQRILDALAMLEIIGVHQADRTQLALFAKASPKSSGYTNNLGALRTAGLIDYPQRGLVALTETGRAIADAGTAPATASELQDFVRSLVGPSKARLLDVLVDAYPEALGKEELAERAGVSPNSSGYTNNLGSLRSLGLIEYPSPGWVAALPVLFLEAA